MKKFLVIFAVTTVVVFQGFAQRVNPICGFPEGESHTTVDVINALTAGINPPGYRLGVAFSDLKPVIKDVVERAVPGQNWMDVLNASVCKTPTRAMMARQYQLWGQVEGKMIRMGNTRNLRLGEQLLVHEPSGKVLAGCQCINPVVEPSDWIPDLITDNYSTIDDDSPAGEQQRSTLRVTDYTSDNGGGQPRTGNSSSTSTSSSSSGSGSNSLDDCYGPNCDELQKKIIRGHYWQLEQYIEFRNRDIRSTNDEYVRVKEAESKIRREDMFNTLMMMMMAQNMCNNCQGTGRSVDHQGVQYVEVRQGDRNAWLAPFLGAMGGGLASGVVNQLLHRGGRPMVQQFSGWNNQPIFAGGRYQYGPGHVPTNGPIPGWEDNFNLNDPHRNNLPNGGWGYQ